MSTVRPDGMITLPLVGDIRAAGLTPEELRKSDSTRPRPKFLTEAERHRRRAADQQPQGLHHRPGHDAGRAIR